MTDPDNVSTPAKVDMPETLTLAGDFPAPTQEQWHKEVLKVLNRGRPEGKQLNLEKGMARLKPTTVDGVKIEPMYTRQDAPEDLGAPGVPPFTRGTTIRTGVIDSWDVRALHEDPDVAFTRKAILTDLERGVTSIWLRVGDDAIAASDIDSVLEGVLLNLAKIEVSSRDDQTVAADALLADIEKSDAKKDEI